ncbi:hypothetical protein DTO027I6_7223 [Penicillium roqueforti]|nr:hypothetical protein CBS147337_7254 [Penicillium roqueforti]KAI2700196.1 hypothetical protein CBS147372_5813 [Penicillium roqueforti]KAI2712790.1 hypothetical protein CBS147318_7393 [Penicillium roqueforti]KAI2734666.1 hypothetical protein DTO012A8_10044 [Penicillium roqueforti]KAI3110147.1 hypothetical protein CBS147333_5068 [Penicillium roqueforti]
MSDELTISDILGMKFAAMESELEYIRCVRDGLNEARKTEKISHDTFQQEIQTFLESFRSSLSTIHVLKAQRPLIIEDIAEQVSAKRQRIEGPVDQSLLEHAYRDARISRVLGARAKQKGSKYDQSAFKKKVYAYYGINEHCRPGFGWCHVLGTVLPQNNIKAAHLVPKSMTSKDVCHLFGVSNGVLGDRRNRITLAENIELLFDRGTIAIVPMPGPMKSPTQWRCVVLDESKKEDTIGFFDGSYMRLKDIDNKPLTFVSDNRPRERYLYFCFIIAYLNAKSRGVSDAVARKVEATRFWPSAGEYLNRSTLVTLARCVSGSELPESLVQDKTFDSGDTSTRDADAGTVLGADVCDAILAMKNL